MNKSDKTRIITIFLPTQHLPSPQTPERGQWGKSRGWGALLTLFISALFLAACLGSTRTPTVVSPPPGGIPPQTSAPIAVTPSAPPDQPPDPATLDPAPTTPLSTGNKLGVHLLLDDGLRPWPVEVWPSHLQYARQAVGDWGYVVQLVRSDNMDVSRWQTFMDLCTENHLTPIIRLAPTFNAGGNFWNAPIAGPDGSYTGIAAQYAQFIASLRWSSPHHYVVVGNEPNHGNEWGNQPDAAQYARFLIDVADALHAADPQAKVLNAGFDPYAPNTNGIPAGDGFIYIDEESFLDGMIAAQPDVFSRIDVWASHSYPTGPFSEPPWDQAFQIDLTNGAVNPHHVEPPPGIFNRGVNGYEWELFKLSTYGIKPLPVLITETGWKHIETGERTSVDNTDTPLYPAKVVAQYMEFALKGNTKPVKNLPTTGFTPWLNDPRVIGVCIFALNGFEKTWGHTNLLSLTRQGDVTSTYPAFDVLAAISAGQ